MMMRLLLLAFMLSGCHTIAIKNSQTGLLDSASVAEDVKMKSTTQFYGFFSTDSSEVSNPCEAKPWQEVRITETRENVTNVVILNGVTGGGAVFTLGMGLMACAPGPYNVACAVGVTGAVFGVLTLFSTPFTDVSPFGAESTVIWKCGAA